VAGNKKAFNPFYALIVIVGTLFAVTAVAYCVMTVRLTDPSGSVSDQFVNFLSKHGFTILISELVCLGAVTFAAMATDEYWDRRAELSEETQGD